MTRSDAVDDIVGVLPGVVEAPTRADTQRKVRTVKRAPKTLVAPSVEAANGMSESAVKPFSKACSVAKVRIGIPEGDWSRIGKMFREVGITDDLPDVVDMFVDWYNGNIWRRANKPLTSSIFLYDFPQWRASYIAGTIQVVTGDSFIWRVDLNNLSLPLDYVPSGYWSGQGKGTWQAERFMHAVTKVSEKTLTPLEIVLGMSTFDDKTRLERWGTRAQADTIVNGILSVVDKWIVNRDPMRLFDRFDIYRAHFNTLNAARVYDFQTRRVS